MRYEGTVYRPPGEWKSYLLQVTVGCSHNACTFCGMYKDKRYRVRPLEEIFEDIALARAAYGDVKRVFLCDGDAVAMDTEELLAVLDRLYETFPSLERVNAYAGPAAPCARRRKSWRPSAGRGWYASTWGWRAAAMRCCGRCARGWTPRACWRPGGA